MSCHIHLKNMKYFNLNREKKQGAIQEEKVANRLYIGIAVIVILSAIAFIIAVSFYKDLGTYPPDESVQELPTMPPPIEMPNREEGSR